MFRPKVPARRAQWQALRIRVQRRPPDWTVRQDLYYRLACIVVELQPLRDRSDMEEIARRPLASNAKAPPAKLSIDALMALMRHSWPGNLRELKFVLQRAQWICEDGVITAEDLALPENGSHEDIEAIDEAGLPGDPLHEAERNNCPNPSALCKRRHKGGTGTRYGPRNTLS